MICLFSISILNYMKCDLSFKNEDSVPSDVIIFPNHSKISVSQSKDASHDKFLSDNIVAITGENRF